MCQAEGCLQAARGSGFAAKRWKVRIMLNVQRNASAVLLQSWSHAQRRRVQLLSEREEVLREGQQRGIALNPSEMYTRVAAGAKGHSCLEKLLSRAPLWFNSGLLLGNGFGAEQFLLLVGLNPSCSCASLHLLWWVRWLVACPLQRLLILSLQA